MYVFTSVSQTQTTPILIPTICGRPATATKPQDDDDNDNEEEEDAAESEENDKQDGLQPLANVLVTLSTPQIVMVQPTHHQGVGGDQVHDHTHNTIV